MGLILPQEVEVGICGVNYQYYENKGYLISRKIDDRKVLRIDMKQKIKVNVLDLMPKCNVLVKIKCDYCEKFDYIPYNEINNSINITKVACKNCKGRRISDGKKYNIVKNNTIIPLYWDKDWLFNEYIINKKTANEIAKVCDVHMRVIYKFINKFNINKHKIADIVLSNNDDNYNNRNSKYYRKWVKDILERDCYTCQCCGKHGGNLNVHHIKNFAQYPDLRLNIDNGITLCEKCHLPKFENSFHRIFGCSNNNVEELLIYIYKYGKIKYYNKLLHKEISQNNE